MQTALKFSVDPAHFVPLCLDSGRSGVATIFSGQEELLVSVDNWSVRGCRFVSPHRSFEIGAFIKIGLNGIGSRPARVVWKARGSYGAEFEETLRREDMVRAFKREQASEKRFRRSVRAGGVQPGAWPAGVRFAVLIGGAILAWALMYGAVKLALAVLG